MNASAAIFRGEKIGLVGPNGAGKSTVFRMIMREESPDDGQISPIDRAITIGYFSQDVGEMAGRPVVTRWGAGAVSDVAAELKHLEEALADPARAGEMDALEDAVHLVRARRVRQRLLQVLELRGDVRHRAGARHHLGDHRPARHLADVLAEVPMVTPRSMETCPSSGDSAMIIRKMVDFPAPFGPTKPIFSPRKDAAEASTNRIWGPCCLLI